MAKQERHHISTQRLLILSSLVLAAAAIVVFVLVTRQSPTATASIQQVSVQDLAAAQAQGAYILDVREPWEYDAEHVAGVNLIPLGKLEQRISELPQDRSIYIMCRSGNRSMKASQLLLEAGFDDVRNVQGGILAWQQAGFAIE